MHAGIATWSAPIAVLLLCVVAWQLPFFAPPRESSGEWGIDVPETSDAHPALTVGPIVRIDALGVSLDGRRVATTEEVRARGEDALAQLATDLETLRANWSIVHPDQPYPGRVSLLAGRGTPWWSIRPVLLRAARAGCPRVAFVVSAPSSEEPPFDWAHFSPRSRLSS